MFRDISLNDVATTKVYKNYKGEMLKVRNDITI